VCDEPEPDEKNSYTSSSHERIDVILDTQSENELSSRMIALDTTHQPHHDKWRAFAALIFLFFSFFVALISLALTHDRLPDRKVYFPLPDVILDNVESVDFLLNVTEIQIICEY
jgi:hypothetical protein